jgi:hypothetical protein
MFENINLTEYSAIVIICLFLIKELFAFLKSKKNGGTEDTNKLLLLEMRLMNNNHLHSIEEAINKGNEKMVCTYKEECGKVVEAIEKLNINK